MLKVLKEVEMFSDKDWTSGNNKIKKIILKLFI